VEKIETYVKLIDMVSKFKKIPGSPSICSEESGNL
jgi:hypothetical protein